MTEQAGAQTDEERPAFPMEEGVRLSESFLWDRQRRFYEQAGVSAWEKAVPARITTTRYIASSYVEVFAAWLRDMRLPSNGELDESHPVYVVELGSGPGRFAFHFLRRLREVLAEREELSGLRVMYVITDVAERNLAFAASHPALEPFFEQGLVDVGRFDLEHPESLHLEHSGATLCPGGVVNPITCIANYIFDTVRQDLFAVDAGRLGEMHISVTSPQPEEDLDDPELLQRVTIAFDTQPVSGAYYHEPDLDAILEQYAAALPDVGFLFPVASLRGLRFLAELSAGRMLLLAGDKGYDRIDLLMAQGGPGIDLHGSGFSLMVNFDAIGRFAANGGGHVLRAKQRVTFLCIVACVFGLPEGATPSCDAAFNKHIAEFGPDHYFDLESALIRHAATLTIKEILAWTRLSLWDPTTMMAAATGLERQLPSATAGAREDVHDAILRAWEEYYHIGERPDAAAVFGRLLFVMQYYREALTFFERSLGLSGPDPATYNQMGMAAYSLQQLDLARQCATQALRLEPDYGPARSLLRKLEADESRR